MPTITGTLKTITGTPDRIVSAGLRAEKTTPTPGGIITPAVEIIPVKNGTITFTAEPGPAIIVLQHATFGKPTTFDAVRLYITETTTELEDAVRAGQAFHDGDEDSLEKLKESIVAAMVQASKDAAVLVEQAGSAQQAAAASQEAAAGAAQSAAASARVADSAAETAKAQAEAAGASATAADSAHKQSLHAAEHAEEFAARAREIASEAGEIGGKVTSAVAAAAEDITTLSVLSDEAKKTLDEVSSVAAQAKSSADRAQEAAGAVGASSIEPVPQTLVKRDGNGVAHSQPLDLGEPDRDLTEEDANKLSDVIMEAASAEPTRTATLRDAFTLNKVVAVTILGLFWKLNTELSEQLKQRDGRLETLESQQWSIQVVDKLPDSPAPLTWYAVVEDA